MTVACVLQRITSVKVDMARLAIVRKRREEAEKQMAEEAAAAAADKEKMEKAIKADTGSRIQKLNPLEVNHSDNSAVNTMVEKRG